MERTIIVEELNANVRLDTYLSDILDDWTRSQIKLQIEKGGVSVNGKVVSKAGYAIKNNDTICINFTISADLINAEPENIPLDIVYEDDYFAIINKPQGMVVHPAPGNAQHTLVNALLYHFKEISTGSESYRPGIVHRIDKDTSGLLVVAKDNISHEKLAKQIAEHTCFRHYYALVEGEMKQDKGIVDQPLGRDPRDRKKMAIVEDGKRAITHYDVIERYKGYTLVHFKLETGRTHQIRVHTKFLNHPIVGDKTYGYAKQKFNLNGQLLHAKSLELSHPKTGERMIFECKLPDYFESILKKLQKIKI